MEATAENAERMPRAKTADLRPLYVWELPVRLTHWLIALSLCALAITGVYIGSPYISVPGEAGHHFVMGTMKLVHYYAAIVFALSVLTRIVWMFVGNEYSRYDRFLPVSRERRRGLLGTLQFYLLLRDRPPFFIGHNPLAGLTYSLVFLLYLVMIATGLGLYGLSAHVDSPFRVFAFLAAWAGGPQSARYIHHLCTWLLIGFVAHHIASAVLVSRVERTGVLDSIFSGLKFVPDGRREGTEE